MSTDWMSQTAAIEHVMIDCGDFWPQLSSEVFYNEYRPPSELPFDTVLTALRLAVIRSRRQLVEWQQEQEAATLAEVEQDTVDDVGDLVRLWERAVFCEAKAELLRETQTADRRKEAENRAKSSIETEDKYREWAATAINQIAGGNRCYVESI